MVQKFWKSEQVYFYRAPPTITVNGVRVADISANFCENLNWGKKWKNTDFEAAEIKVSAFGNNVIDGYRVVGKEGNLYMIYFKLFAVVKLVYLM